MTTKGWTHANDVRDRQLATAIGYRIKQGPDGWIVTDRKTRAGRRGDYATAIYSGPWICRGTAVGELARLGHQLLATGVVTLS